MTVRIDIRYDTIHSNAYHHWRTEELVAKYGRQDWCEFPTSKKLHLQLVHWLKQKWEITVVENDTFAGPRDPGDDYCYYDFPTKEHAWQFYDFYKDKGMEYWEAQIGINPHKKHMLDFITFDAYKVNVAILNALATKGTVPSIPKWEVLRGGNPIPCPPITEIIYTV